MLTTGEYGGLTLKERRFVEEYLTDLNGAQAAIRAGYSANGASQTGYRLRRKPAVAAAIAKALAPHSERLEGLRQRLIEELARCSLADPRELFVAGPDGRPELRPLEELSPEAAGTIAEIVVKTFEGGQSLRVRQHGKIDAAKALCKLLGWSTERLEVRGSMDIRHYDATRDALLSKLGSVAVEMSTDLAAQLELERGAIARLRAALPRKPDLLADLALWTARLDDLQASYPALEAGEEEP